ncbi:MAG: hypothetical protein ACK5NF_04070 [Bacilli bacterium]
MSENFYLLNSMLFICVIIVLDFIFMDGTIMKKVTDDYKKVLK